MRHLLVAIVTRRPVVWLAVPLACAAGWVARPTGVASWPATVELLSGQVGVLALPIALAGAAWVFCVDSDDEMTGALHLAGVLPVRWATLRTLVVTGITVLVAGAFAIAPLVSQALGGHNRPSSNTLISSSLVLMALTLVLTPLWCSALILGRSARVSLTLALVVLTADTSVSLAGSDGLAGIARALVPTSGLRLIAAGSTGRDHAAGTIAVAVVVLATTASLWRLSHPGARPVAHRPHPRLGPVAASGLIIGFAAGSGFVLPVALREQLPFTWRPSVLLARASGQAPEQQVTRFFDGVWAGDPGRVASLTTTGSPLDLLGTRPDLLSRPASATSFYLAAMPGTDTADVRADGWAEAPAFCLRRVVDRWLLDRLAGPAGCPP